MFNPNFNGIGSDLSGKFIWLKFREDNIQIADKKDWEDIQNAYIEFTTDSAGFAKILSDRLFVTLKTNFLKIKIKENQFIAGDLMIDGVPFKEMIGDTGRLKHCNNNLK